MALHFFQNISPAQAPEVFFRHRKYISHYLVKSRQQRDSLQDLALAPGIALSAADIFFDNIAGVLLAGNRQAPLPVRFYAVHQKSSLPQMFQQFLLPLQSVCASGKFPYQPFAHAGIQQKRPRILQLPSTANGYCSSTCSSLSFIEFPPTHVFSYFPSYVCGKKIITVSGSKYKAGRLYLPTSSFQRSASASSHSLLFRPGSSIT